MTISRLLIIKLSSLGDVLHYLWLVPTIKKTYPQLKLSWAVNNSYVELLKLFPQIDEVIGLEDITSIPQALQKIFHLPKYFEVLRKTEYDVVIDAHGLLRSGIFTGLTKAKKKIGFAPPEGREGCHWFYTEAVNVARYLNVVDKYSALLGPIGINELITERPQLILSSISENGEGSNPDKINNFFQTHFNKKSAPKILLNPSASFYTKELPVNVIRELAQTIHKKYQVPLMVLFDPTKKSFVSALTEDKNICLTPSLSLVELVHFTKTCNVVIGTDSGPTYMAELLGVPSITLFGPTNAGRQSPSNSVCLWAKRVFNYASKKVINSNDRVEGKKTNISLYSKYVCPIIKSGEIRTPYRCIKRNCKDNQCMKQFEGELLLQELENIL